MAKLLIYANGCSTISCPPKGLLVGKQELMNILDDKHLTKMFIELVRSCKGVVAYRYPPLNASLFSARFC